MKPTDEHMKLAQIQPNNLVWATYEVTSYNTRRLSKPWIAHITDWSNQYPTLNFGTSDTYTAIIQLPVGSIVKYGQKDYRNHNKHVNNFGIVTADGSIQTITAAQARILYSEQQK